MEESRSEQEDHYKWRICMNRVKKFITGIIFLVMLTVSLNVFAEDISVTLNGSNIVFEDAKPII